MSTATEADRRAGLKKEWAGWINSAEALADWMLVRYFVRRDVYGLYRDGKQFTERMLDRETVIRHCRGEITIGAHTTSTEGYCLWVNFDIDAHDDKADPTANYRLALAIVEKAKLDYGLGCVTFDSNGKGGFHVTIYFVTKIPVAVAYWLCQQLVSIYPQYGFDKAPEFFPKQPGLSLDHPYGNWCRVPGMHHTRPHWTYILANPSKNRWALGAEAAKILTHIRGNEPKRVLDAYHAAHNGAAVQPPTDTWTMTAEKGRKRKDYDPPDEATVRSALGFLPNDWADSYGGSRFDCGWLGVGMCLHNWDNGATGLAIWKEFSSGCPNKYDAGVCDAKWGTFTQGSGFGIETIFKAALDRGWKFPEPEKKAETNGSTNGHHETNGQAVEPWPIGTWVKALDRDNFGRVAHDDGGSRLAIHFVSPSGHEQTVTLPRAQLIRLDGPDGKPASPAIDYASMSDADLGILAADAIEPENVEPLWAGRLYVGKLNLMAGEGGDGKSQTMSRVVAAVTNPEVTMPDGTKALRNGNCIIVAPEDGAADTIIPRLLAAGADVSKVKIVTAKVTVRVKDSTPDGTLCVSLMSFQDHAYWREVIRRVGNVLLLVADPIPACLGRGVNDHKNQEVRMVLEPFVDMMNELRVGLLGITHLGKSPDVKSPTHKILGSVAYANMSRSTHLTARDPDDPKRRLLFHLKNTYGDELPTLAYRITEQHIERKDGELVRTSRVEYEAEPVEANAADVLSANRNPGKKRGPKPEQTMKVAEWLWDYLNARAGPQLWAAIIDDAGEAGLVGKRGPDGRWTGKSSLYDGQRAVEALTGHRAGYRVDSFKAASTRSGKELTHWHLVQTDARRAAQAFAETRPTVVGEVDYTGSGVDDDCPF